MVLVQCSVFSNQLIRYFRIIMLTLYTGRSSDGRRVNGGCACFLASSDSVTITGSFLSLFYFTEFAF